TRSTDLFRRSSSWVRIGQSVPGHNSSAFSLSRLANAARTAFRQFASAGRNFLRAMSEQPRIPILTVSLFFSVPGRSWQLIDNDTYVSRILVYHVRTKALDPGFRVTIEKSSR